MSINGIGGPDRRALEFPVTLAPKRDSRLLAKGNFCRPPVLTLLRELVRGQVAERAVWC